MNKYTRSKRKNNHEDKNSTSAGAHCGPWYILDKQGQISIT
uniref:Uncharacterized protein n=1 Tax=uncultured bacterium BLR12 TaxID=506514 RepID=C0IND3_9BACT|nr:hypothetical protein AKSOIL_0204 [uncultured bacterium BLR12]